MLSLPGTRAQSPASEQLRSELTTQATPGELLDIDEPEALFSEEPTLWDGVKRTFQADFRRFDRLLLRLHYRRAAPLESTARAAIWRFLSTGYVLTGDIRYFNEFLWFGGEDDERHLALNLDEFHRRLDGNGRHSFPLCSRAEAAQSSEALQPVALPEQQAAAPPGLRIGILGSPDTFCSLFTALRQEGHEPTILFFAHDANPMKRIVRSTRLLSKLYFALRGCRVPYDTIHTHYRAPVLREQLGAYGFDIGVQSVPFIIKQNILDAFRLGVLNAHLALLPFVRGRSSVEFSLLSGFPLGATVHFVDEGVDTGPVVRFYPTALPTEEPATLASVKRAVAATAADAFLDALRRVSAPAFAPSENPPEKGLQYYTMHRALVEYVEKRIVPGLGNQRDERA